MAMTVKDIYEATLRILAESLDEGDNADYEERAPYLIAAFCTQTEDVDRALRKSLGESSQMDFNSVYIALEDEFPLLDRFAPAAALYLASMLVMDDFEALSDRLYEKYCDHISKICDNFPTLNTSIVDKYGFR